jgi:acyl carrier protein
VKASSLEKNLVVPVEGDIRDSDIAWIASNGTPRMDTAILIADPESGAIMQSGCLGEIWASGNTVAMGYWGKPALTNGVFRASPAGTNDPKWLRTGDLGFLHKGDLYITGRLKDLVIINGRNFYPQDIEEVIGNCHPAVRKSCTAAFAIDVKGKERLAIVAELHRSIFPRDHEKILDAIASSVSVEFEIQPVRITLVRTGAVVKTSSGKIMRRANREALLTGQFEPVSERFYEAQELTAGVYADGGLPSLGQFILSWASARLNNGEPAIPGRSLTSYGLDSMRAMELSEEVKNIFGFEWSPTLFFEEIPIAALVQEGLKIMEEG